MVTYLKKKGNKMLGYNELKLLFPNRSKDFIYKLIRRLKKKYKCTHSQCVISADYVSIEFGISVDTIIKIVSLTAINDTNKI